MHKHHGYAWLPAIVIPLSVLFALVAALPGKTKDVQALAPKALAIAQPASPRPSIAVANRSEAAELQAVELASTRLVTVTVSLPLVLRNDPWVSPFGAEVGAPLAGALLARADALGIDWVRMHRVSWRDVQPEENGPYDWSVLSTFEAELRGASAAGLTPMVIVHHSPLWATINIPFPTDCGAIRPDKYGAFAAFMQAVVNRYKQPPFNVRYWELGNEPDVDPTLVDPDQVFGCWGKIGDPYYGGREYGAMLKVVTPAIRAADPSAKVLIGGLLLGKPAETDPTKGQPELFLSGILAAGAAPYFDILPYHVYPSYMGVDVDYDNGPWTGQWEDRGGLTLGKARFLRDILAQYGVSKPLFVNEMALICNDFWYTCDPPPASFFEAQADFIPRTFSRGLSEGLQGYVWYTLDGPGWRDGGLLDGAGSLRPAYIAYQNLATRLSKTVFETKPYYGPGVEAYAFGKGPRVIHVIWSIDATPDTILVLKSKFLAAYTRDGAALSPTVVGETYQFNVGFSPIYVELKR